MPIFYHYTSAKGAKAIVNNPVINASESRGGFPAGAHFTTLGKLKIQILIVEIM